MKNFLFFLSRIKKSLLPFPIKGYFRNPLFLIMRDKDYYLDDIGTKDPLYCLKYLQKARYDIHEENEKILRNAASKGKLGKVKFLVKHGANVNARNDYQPILNVIINGNMKMVKFLINSGADIYSDLELLIRYLIYYDELDLLKQVYKMAEKARYGGNFYDDFDKAIKYGKIKIVKYIIDYIYIDIDKMNNYIDIAIRNNDLDMVVYLTERFLSLWSGIEGSKYIEKKVLKWLINKGYINSIKYLADEIDKKLDIFSFGSLAVNFATESGHLKIIKYLISKGLDINSYTLLPLAAEKGHLEIVKYLMKNQNEEILDIETKKEALLEAIENEKLNVVSYLTQEGIKL